MLRAAADTRDFLDFGGCDIIVAMDHAGTDFGWKLARMMSEYNISRVDLARALGIDRSAVARWLGHVSQPTDRNLTRLTDIMRRHKPDLQLDYWRDPGAMPLSSSASPAEAIGGRTVSLRLRAPRRPEIEALYPGLWAGFYNSTQNRGAVVLCAMRISASPTGLDAVFTDGRVQASGPVIDMGARIHAVLDLAPAHDRLCVFVLNGIGADDAVVMDGIYAISAGESQVCATASPILLFRVAGTAEDPFGDDTAAVAGTIRAVNVDTIKASIEAGNPIAGLAHLVPESVLRKLCPVVGVPGEDTTLDHVLRMPPARALPYAHFGPRELPLSSDVHKTRRALRRLLGLG